MRRSQSPVRDLPLGTLLNSAGLLWKYGLPAGIDRLGQSFLLLESDNQAEVELAKRHDRLSRIGIVLLAIGFAIGFALQLASNFVRNE